MHRRSRIQYTIAYTSKELEAGPDTLEAAPHEGTGETQLQPKKLKKPSKSPLNKKSSRHVDEQIQEVSSRG
jgi:hypothetical protein